MPHAPTETSRQSLPKAQLVRRLLAWYGRSKRNLPWRRTRDPYRIWLSEVMLQQTRVETVIPYYRRFLRRFPTLSALAAAPLDDVLKLWEGLGYYARARNLHAAVRRVVAEHGGRVPSRLEALRALPGVGRYTAGAILSIAFNQPCPVLDGNVERVLARLLAVRGDARAGAARRRLWAVAESLIPNGRAGEFNQALMELGALVCTPRSPACAKCPVAGLCKAARLGIQEKCPARRRRVPVPHYEVGVGVVRRRGRLLIARRPARGLLGGLWEFPGGKREGAEPLEETVRREVREELGLRVAVESHLTTCRHAYSHFRVTLHAYQCRCVGGRLRPLQADACRWVTPQELDAYALPSGTLKIIRRLREALRRGRARA